MCNGDILMHSGSFGDIKECTDVHEYLSKKGSNHLHYRYYASANRINRIVSDCAIYLTDGSKWNDKFDKRNFNPSYFGSKRFGICMSHATCESIAMWMLYGGRSGDGAMIDFDKEILKSAMKASEFEFGYFEGNNFVCKKRLSSDDVQIKLIDIMYFKEDESGDKYILHRESDKPDKAEVSQLTFRSFIPFVKHEAWAYEQEVRMVATVEGRLLDNSASEFECMKLPIDIPEDYLKQRIINSPTSNAGLYRDSSLVDTVDWDLCCGCELRQ